MIRRKIVSTLYLVALAMTVIYACGEAPKPVQKEEVKKVKKRSLNPNGDSELALLMRSMFEEAEQIKEQVKKGEKPQIKLDHGKILTAHATEPEKAASKEFKDFAKMYLANLEQLKKAKPENVEMVYQSLVQSCMSCHQQLCPGPVVRIKKLRI